MTYGSKAHATADQNPDGTWTASWDCKCGALAIGKSDSAKGHYTGSCLNGHRVVFFFD